MPSSPPQARLERRKYPGTDWKRYRVTPHFRLGEFIRDQEQPPEEHVMRQVRRFCIRILEPLRDRYGPCIVISGHRTPARNRAVGGARWSWHVWEWHPGEMGVDVVFRRGNPSQWSAAAAEGPAGGIGTYRGHTHLDDRSTRTRWWSEAQ
jgi:uncharacterized protein YcbK (DUF882 family)